MTLFSASREKFNSILERISRAGDEMRVFSALCAPVDASLGAYLSAGSDAELGAARRHLRCSLARYPFVCDPAKTPDGLQSTHRLCIWFRGATRKLNAVHFSASSADSYEDEEEEDSCEAYADRFVDNRVDMLLLADMVFESVKLGADMPRLLREFNSKAVLFESAKRRLNTYTADENTSEDDSSTEDNLIDVVRVHDDNLQRAAWLLFDEIVQSGDERFKFPNSTFRAGLDAGCRLHPWTQSAANWPIAIAITEERQRQRDAEIAACNRRVRWQSKKKRRANKK
jgi:hypothetical protein